MPCLLNSPFGNCQGPDGSPICDHCWIEEMKPFAYTPFRPRPPRPDPTASPPPPVVLGQTVGSWTSSTGQGGASQSLLSLGHHRSAQQTSSNPPTASNVLLGRSQNLQQSTANFGGLSPTQGEAVCRYNKPLPPLPKRRLTDLRYVPAPTQKIYEDAGKTLPLHAKTIPHNEGVWADLVWTEGASTSHGNVCDITLAPAGIKRVSVTLDDHTLHADLEIRRWPRLKITEEEFHTWAVVNDGQFSIDNAFDNKWKEGRPAPGPYRPVPSISPVGVPTAQSQSPIGVTRGKKIRLTPTFKVTKKPTHEEVVPIKGLGRLTDGTTLVWDGSVVVGPAAIEGTTTISAGPVISNSAVPNHVQADDHFAIEWFMQDYDGKTWLDAGETDHLLYVVLGDPKATAYWTLLDISCRAAEGKSTEADFVPSAFEPFKTHVGDGNGFRRKGDEVELSYYLQGVATSGDNTEPSVYSTRGILSRPDGTGRCGGWASLLIHMFQIHGVQSKKYWMIRDADMKVRDKTKRFLVKTCIFKGAGSAQTYNDGTNGPGFYSQGNQYTHFTCNPPRPTGMPLPPLPVRTGYECYKQDNAAPGQGKNNPQFDFGDHVVVKHGGKLYDPSYGLGPFTTQAAYEAAALDGLGSIKHGYFEFKNGDNTEQFISLTASKSSAHPSPMLYGYFIYKSLSRH